MLQFVEGPFNQVALPVQFPIVFPRIPAVGFGRYDRFGSLVPDKCEYAVASIPLVSDDRPGLDTGQQGCGLADIRPLSAGEGETNRPALCVVHHVNLGAESAAGASDGPERYRVIKMRWGGSSKAPDHSTIVYNDWITRAGIPDDAHEYIVGPRSVLAWLLDRYQVTTDKVSGIVSDSNDWGAEIGNPRYIIDLVKRVTMVSVETMAIVRALPPLDEASQSTKTT